MYECDFYGLWAEPQVLIYTLYLDISIRAATYDTQRAYTQVASCVRQHDPI